jgi:hypothetical protein
MTLTGRGPAGAGERRSQESCAGGAGFPHALRVASCRFGVMVSESGAGAQAPLARGQASGVRARGHPAEPRDGQDGPPNHWSI